MRLRTLTDQLEDYSPQHTVFIRLPGGGLANITDVSVQHDLGVVIIGVDSAQPLENAPAEPLDESRAPMGTGPDDPDLNGGK